MDRLAILTFNALAYTAAGAYFYKRTGLSVGLVIWAVYTLSAWCSVFFVMQPDFAGCFHDEPITSYNGLGYLFVTLLLFIYPLTLVRKAERGKMSFNHPQQLRLLMIGAIAVQLLFILVNLPSAMEVLAAGNDSLSDYRDEVYEDASSPLASNPWLNRIALLFNCVPQICLGVSIYLLFCYKEDRKLVKWLFGVTITCIAISTIVQVSRGSMVLTVIFIAITLVYMRDFISSKLKRILLVYGLPAIFVLVSFFWAISVSRFGDLANFMMFKYLGEPMVNFAGILYAYIDGCAWGHAYFQPITYMITGVKDFVTAEKWEYIESVTGITGQIFYTFVGSLIIDFGFVVTFIIACVFNRLGMRLTRSQSNLSLGSVICLFFLIYLYSSGVFFLTVQNFNGVFMILYTVILGYYFRNTTASQAAKIPRRH